jgi:hypothetical protein
LADVIPEQAYDILLGDKKKLALGVH